MLVMLLRACLNRQVEYTMYIVRTPILLLPPCIFYLIRRKMHSVRCEYIISLVQSSLSTLCKFSLASFSSNVCERDVLYPTERIQLAEYKHYCHVNRNCLPFQFYVGSMFLMRRFQLIRHGVSSPDSSLSNKWFLVLSNHLRFGRPLRLFHGSSITNTLLPTHYSSHLNTWPYHSKLHSCTFWIFLPRSLSL